MIVAAVESAAGHTRVRVGVAVVVILVTSSVVGLVIITRIILLPPPKDHTCSAFLAVSGATRRPNV